MQERYVYLTKLGCLCSRKAFLYNRCYNWCYVTGDNWQNGLRCSLLPKFASSSRLQLTNKLGDLGAGNIKRTHCSFTYKWSNYDTVLININILVHVNAINEKLMSKHTDIQYPLNTSYSKSDIVIFVNVILWFVWICQFPKPWFYNWLHNICLSWVWETHFSYWILI